MNVSEEIKKVLEIIEECIHELEIHCKYICDATNCIDCRVHVVKDRLVEIITLLNGE